MKIKGVVLAGGTGSRLMPLTKVTNKHLLPVGHKPMIFYPIEQLKSAGISEIMIVTGVEHMGDVVSLLGSGHNFGCNFTYRVQDEAGGIAQALGLAKGFVREDEAMAVILGDNIFENSFAPTAKSYLKQGGGARVLVKEVHDPGRFGVAEINDNKIMMIEEKPAQPKSNYAVTGVYFYDANVFSIIENLQPSNRGELEITDVNNHYAREGKLCFDIVDGWWTDAGTFPSLALANKLILQKEK